MANILIIKCAAGRVSRPPAIPAQPVVRWDRNRTGQGEMGQGNNTGQQMQEFDKQYSKLDKKTGTQDRGRGQHPLSKTIMLSAYEPFARPAVLK